MKKTTFIGFFLSLFCLSWAQPALAHSQEAICYPTDNCREFYCMSPCGQNHWDFAADFLYWSTDFNALSAIGAEIATTETTADASIQIKHPNQQWDPGVRLTAALIDCDNWDITGSWTYFRNASTNHRTPFQLQVNVDNLNTSGSSRFVFTYNAADLELGTTLCLRPCLFARPFIGIHAIWTQIDSRLHLIAPPSTGPDIDTDGFTVGINMNNHSWGVGPRIGINTLWGNFRGCSLVANVNGALVYGEQRAKINAEVDITSDVDINIHVTGDSHWQLMSTIQMQGGLSYLSCFCNNSFRINLLWECNVLNQANNILIFDRAISTQGLTLGLDYLF